MLCYYIVEHNKYNASNCQATNYYDIDLLVVGSNCWKFLIVSVFLVRRLTTLLFGLHRSSLLFEKMGLSVVVTFGVVFGYRCLCLYVHKFEGFMF